MKKYTCFLLVVIALLSLVPLPQATQAQQPEKVPPRVVVMHKIITERANALDLAVYFTVRDEQGRAVSPEDISRAGIVVRDDEPAVSAPADASETPIKIALVMDASGSMREYLRDVRPAAIAAINSAPSDAQIAIFSFARIEPGDSERFFPVVDFTNDRDKLRDYINTSYDPQSLAPTCLFNAGFGAINYMNSNLGEEERRAVILFTDGRDEVGAGNPNPCSDKTAEDVIEKATPQDATATPIFTVGLCTVGGGCGNLDESVMRRLADRSNGAFLAGSRTQITDVFGLVMKEITSQKYARATIRPCEERQVVLQVSVINVGDDLQAVIPLGEHKCYAPEAIVKIDDFRKLESENNYTFNLDIQNPSGAAMDDIEIQVIGPGNTAVYSQTVQKKVPADSDLEEPITIPGIQLKSEGKHIVQVQARTEQDVLFETRGAGRGTNRSDDILVQREFDHVPVSSVSMQISSKPAIDYEADTFTVNGLEITDPLKSLDAVKDDFVTYQVIILDGNTTLFQSKPANFDPDSPRVVVPISEITEIAPEVIPTDKTKRLLVAVKLNAPDLEVTSPPFSFDFPVPEKASFFEKYGVYCLIVLFVLLVTAAVVYFVRNRRARPRMIPQPYQPSGYGDRSQSQPITNSRSAPPPPAPAPPRGASPRRDDATMVFQPASQTQAQRLRIRVLQTPDLSQKRDEVITTFPHVIGREGNFPIRGDASISRRHAEIFAQGGTFYIRDLESVNGLFVNDVRQESNQPVMIDGRTVVRVGLFTYLELEPK